MAKVIDPDLLAQGTEVVISTASYTIQLLEAGDLSEDGVSLQCVYSFLKEEWKTDAGLIPHPFPIIAITEESMELHDTWNWADATTKNLIRDGGWALKSGSVSNEEYMNLTTLGSFNLPDSDYAYYQQSSSQNTTQSAVYPGPMNERVRIYASETSYPGSGFDHRDYFKIYLRVSSSTYDSYDLITEQNLTALTYKKYALPLSNTTDIKITHDDGYISTGSDYSSITIAYYTESQARTIGAASWYFDTIIDGNSKTAEQIYEKIQYQLRQYIDIDTRADYSHPITGSVANELLEFIGDTLRTKTGVYIDNYAIADTNRLEFSDTGSEVHTFPYVAAGALFFNDNLRNDPSASYWMFFTSVPAGAFGSPTAVIVEDNDGLPITGSINTSASVEFSFDYDGNVQGGRTFGTPAPVTVVAIGLETAQYVKTTSDLVKSTTNNISLVAALERNYENPV